MTEVIKLDRNRGAVFAIAGPLVGIILWTILWWFGFIASLVAFAMAWLTVRLYKKGAGGIDKQSLEVIIPYVVAGMILAFIAVFTLDGAYYAQEELDGLKGHGIWQILTSSQFWAFNLGSLMTPQDVAQYWFDILVSVVFGILGIYPVIKEVGADESGTEKDAKTAGAKAVKQPESKQLANAEQRKQKRAWIAVVGNLIPGVGYLYLDVRRAFGWMLVTSQALLFSALLIGRNDPVAETNPLGDSLGMLAFLILGAAFMLDAYFETKRVNANK